MWYDMNRIIVGCPRGFWGLSGARRMGNGPREGSGGRNSAPKRSGNHRFRSAKRSNGEFLLGSACRCSGSLGMAWTRGISPSKEVPTSLLRPILKPWDSLRLGNSPVSQGQCLPWAATDAKTLFRGLGTPRFQPLCGSEEAFFRGRQQLDPPSRPLNSQDKSSLSSHYGGALTRGRCSRLDSNLHFLA